MKEYTLSGILIGKSSHRILEKKLQSDFSQKVFVGKNAIKEFLTPENHAPLPLVELPEELNPFRKDGVRILAKLLTFLPGGQVKSGTGYELLTSLQKEGKLDGIHTLYEASSGNTVGIETLLAPHFGTPGIQKTIAVVHPGTPEGKIKFLQILGAHVVITHNNIKKAKNEGKKKGAINPGQYENPANPQFFNRILGPQIWKQTQGKITLFCAGLGSGGTIIGTSKYLKKQNPAISIIGVMVKEGDSVPGVRTRTRLREVSLPWEKAISRTQTVSTYDAYRQSLLLIRKAALLAGPSSGHALQGLLQELKKLKQHGKLADLKNKNGEIVAVFPVTDSPLAYTADYFTYLDNSFFAPVQTH